MRIDRIGPGIDNDIGLKPDKRAIGFRMKRDRIMMFAGIGGRHQMLTAILDPADRAFDLHRHPGDVDLFGQQHAFIPEPAADIGRDNPHLILTQPQTFTERIFQNMRNL